MTLPNQSSNNTHHPSPSEIESFEQTMASEIPYFVDMTDKAFAEMLAYKGTLTPGRITRNWEANEMNSRISEYLSINFGAQYRKLENGRFYFVKEDKYIILFKKLSMQFKPSNKETKA